MIINEIALHHVCNFATFSQGNVLIPVPMQSVGVLDTVVVVYIRICLNVFNTLQRWGGGGGGWGWGWGGGGGGGGGNPFSGLKNTNAVACQKTAKYDVN